MALLSEEEIAKQMRGAPGWSRAGGEIRRTFTFGGFREALAFVAAVADLAEAADHHPDIDIRYDRVTLVLSTHDAGGLTAHDFGLAAQIDAIS